MSALADCYARPSTPFGELGPMYDALGHRGKDYSRSARQPIIAYDDMVIESIPAWSSGLGYTVGLRRKNLGGFAGYAHIYGLVGDIGTEIEKGEPIAYVAGAGDRPGSLWTGPHIHTTESHVSAYNAAAGVRPLTDPGPAIAAAAGSSPAGGGHVPIGEDEVALADDIDWINQGAENPASLKAIRGEIDALRADLNYVHQVGPYSLKAIREAQANGQPINLTDMQVKTLAGQVVTGVTAGLATALDEDQAAVLAAIRALPDEVRATIKNAL